MAQSGRITSTKLHTVDDLASWSDKRASQYAADSAWPPVRVDCNERLNLPELGPV
jgi:hypothetical protein